MRAVVASFSHTEAAHLVLHAARSYSRTPGLRATQALRVCSVWSQPQMSVRSGWWAGCKVRFAPAESAAVVFTAATVAVPLALFHSFLPPDNAPLYPLPHPASVRRRCGCCGLLCTRARRRRVAGRAAPAHGSLCAGRAGAVEAAAQAHFHTAASTAAPPRRGGNGTRGAIIAGGETRTVHM